MFGIESAIFTGAAFIDYTMSGEDIVLSAFLTSVSAPTDIDINITIDGIVGGVASAGLTIDDVSAYKSVNIYNENDVQGKVGANAIEATFPFTFIDNGVTLTDVDSGAIAGGSNVIFTNTATGRILAGGGSGGVGGLGGTGEDADWHSAFTYFTSDGKVQSGWGTSPDMSVWWGGAPWHVYNGSPGWVIWKIDAPGTADMWERGVNADGHWYYLRYGKNRIGVGGTGGTGGVGQGYLQSLTNGIAGTSGTWRSGAGGAGGNGGSWGNSGNSGNQGGTGLFYTTSSPNTPRSGSAGSAGTSAGWAIKLN